MLAVSECKPVENHRSDAFINPVPLFKVLKYRERLDKQARVFSTFADFFICRTMKRKTRGRPPTYVWSENQKLTESEKRTKLSIERRRERQRKSYYKKKNKETNTRTEITSDCAIIPKLATPLEDYIFDDFFCLNHEKQNDTYLKPLVVVREYPSGDCLF